MAHREYMNNRFAPTDDILVTWRHFGNMRVSVRDLASGVWGRNHEESSNIAASLS